MNDFVVTFVALLLMRKISAISLALVYLFLSIGIGIGIHYCSNKVSRVGLFASSTCGCQKMAKKKSCCRDEYKVVKIQENHSPSAAVEPNLVKEISLFNQAPIPLISRLCDGNPILHFAGSSPPVPKPVAYLINCSFLI